MARHLAFGGIAKPTVGLRGRPVGRSVTCVASLAFVIVLGAAFWAATAWIGEVLLQLGAGN